jgi:hypothetical protein
VACRLPLFDFLPVVFQFWSADDDFPASIQLLWDKNTTDFMHFETVWYAAGYVLDRLAALVSENEKNRRVPPGPPCFFCLQMLE